MRNQAGECRVADCFASASSCRPDVSASLQAATPRAGAGLHRLR